MRLGAMFAATGIAFIVLKLAKLGDIANWHSVGLSASS